MIEIACNISVALLLKAELPLGWSGGPMVLGKLPVPGRPTILITVGQGPIALAVGASVGCLDIFTLLCPFSPLSPSLWETARYRLKYCLKGPLNQNQPTNNRTSFVFRPVRKVIITRSRSLPMFAPGKLLVLRILTTEWNHFLNKT